MTIRRVVLGLLLALLALGAISPPRAYAGGPTSVLMVNPDGRTAAAYYTDAVYEDLSYAVGDGSVGPLDPPASVGRDRTPTVRVSWLVHDVSIWRLDQIHLTPDDGIWVETLLDTGSGLPWEAGGHWHRPTSADKLTAALTAAGLLSDRAPAGPVGPHEAAPSADAAPPAETGAAAGVPTPAVAALAGLGGLVLGAALIGVWGARRRDLPAGPAPVTAEDTSEDVLRV